MAKHQWSIVCDQAIVDRFTNNLTIVNIIEQVSLTIQRTGKASEATSSPVVLVDFKVVSLWHRSEPSVEEDGKARIRLLSPSGKPLAPDSELRIELTGDKLRTRNILNCRGIPIRETGEHQVQIQQLQKNGRWKTDATIPIIVTINILPGFADGGGLKN